MAEQEDVPPQSKPTGKSKIKKISFWAGLFRNFFTIIASIVSVVTLFILIRQNENTYRPDLEVSVEIPFFEIRHFSNPASCQDIQLFNTHDSVMDALAVSVVNLGMGAAKEVVVDWRFQHEKMLDTARLGQFLLPTGVKLDKKTDVLMFGSCIFQQSGDERLDYVLPVNQAKQPVTVDLPAHFLPLWSNLLIRATQTSTDKEHCIELVQLFCEQHCNLELTLSYRDINQKPYKKQFNVYVFPRYIDVGANKIVCSLSTKKGKAVTANTDKNNLTVLFPDRTMRTVKF